MTPQGAPEPLDVLAEVFDGLDEQHFNGGEVITDSEGYGVYRTDLIRARAYATVCFIGQAIVVNERLAAFWSRHPRTDDLLVETERVYNVPVGVLTDIFYWVVGQPFEVARVYVRRRLDEARAGHVEALHFTMYGNAINVYWSEALGNHHRWPNGETVLRVSLHFRFDAVEMAMASTVVAS